MITERTPTNMDLITPPREEWKAPVRTQFKLIVTVSQVALPDVTIMKFQKKVEDLAVSMFKGGNVIYIIE